MIKLDSPVTFLSARVHHIICEAGGTKAPPAGMVEQHGWFRDGLLCWDRLQSVFQSKL